MPLDREDSWDKFDEIVRRLQLDGLPAAVNPEDTARYDPPRRRSRWIHAMTQVNLPDPDALAAATADPAAVLRDIRRRQVRSQPWRRVLAAFLLTDPAGVHVVRLRVVSESRAMRRHGGWRRVEPKALLITTCGANVYVNDNAFDGLRIEGAARLSEWLRDAPPACPPPPEHPTRCLCNQQGCPGRSSRR